MPPSMGVFCMEALEILLRNVINLDPNEVMNEFISQGVVEKFILDLEKERLFTFGEDSRGKTLGQYSESTKQRKRVKGLPSGHITLFETGEFYDSFTLTLTGDGFILNANAKKSETNLFERYGNDILGLSDEDFEKFIEYSIDGLRQIILSKIFEGL